MKIFFEVVLPVLLIFVAGFGLQKWKKLDIKSVSTLAIFILQPALVFRTFYKADLNAQYLHMVVFAFILLFVIIILNKIYAKVMKYPEADESALILSTAFMNSGNYGAPIVLFAYGKVGFNFSVTFMVIQSIIMNFFGVYYAARGQAGVKLALKRVLEMPATYATVIALIFNVVKIPVPTNIYDAINLLGDATIPVVMLVLGMQLAEIKLAKFEWDKLSFGLTMRLIVSPLIAAIIVMFIPVDPILKKVLILSTAMPSAATTTMYAVQFNTRPQLVSTITMMTTLISIVTITGLLAILG